MITVLMEHTYVKVKTVCKVIIKKAAKLAQDKAKKPHLN